LLSVTLKLYLLALPPVVTNLLPLIILVAVWLIVFRPLMRRSKNREEHRETKTEVSQNPKTHTKSQFIWKIGVMYWGGFMFLVFAIIGPLIPHFMMGKPLTTAEYISNGISSAFIMFPGGAAFGWFVWYQSKKNRNMNR
jgi:hypothetical protein